MRCVSAIICVLVAVSLAATPALAKKTPDEKKPIVMNPQNSPSTLPSAGPVDMSATLAETTVLGWWQFDDPHSGGADPQGWTAHDRTAQRKTYFHIDGNVAEAGCNNIAPVTGGKSMWCGQWATSADPWCSWATLPGYGADWDQRLLSDTLVCDTLTWSWTAVWDTEPGYDFGYAEYFDASKSLWQPLPIVSGYGKYEGTGGPVVDTHEIVPPGGWTQLRYRFVSDGGWDDEDGIRPSNEGALKVDDITVACSNGPAYFRDFEEETCRETETADGFWRGAASEPYGVYARLVHGSAVVQEDPCRTVRSWVWGFFDDPEVTNYACGGWPEQGAVPYVRNDADNRCIALDNEIRSPWVPIAGAGGEYRLSFLTYRDFDGVESLIFYTWRVRTKGPDGCPGEWSSPYLYYGPSGYTDWCHKDVSIGLYIPPDAVEIQIGLAAIDMYCVWGFDWPCHSHAPLFDQVRLVRVATEGPIWTVDHRQLWQDNFPEEGGIGPADYARCDMAYGPKDIHGKVRFPGDSLVVGTADVNGLADDDTGGRSGKAVYVFVRVTDRFGNAVAGKNGLTIQSPDDRAYAGDSNAGLLRWPLVAALAPAGWDAYRMDRVYEPDGSGLDDTFCADLMDLGFGPTGPHYNHANENTAANTGIFAPGDVIRYFLGARNTLGEWSYWHRTLQGQGFDHVTNDINVASASPCEWSVLPDAGRAPGDAGDILFVDDADDRAGPPQVFFDQAFQILGIADAVDRFDVLDPSLRSYNSLESRVKNTQTQIIGGPTEIYQKILWNSSDLSSGLMSDGVSGSDYSDDFALADTFLTYHTDNPGWAYWGNDVARDWCNLVGASAARVKNVYMNHTLLADDQRTVTGIVSPVVFSDASLPSPWGSETFYANGGCPAPISDFDCPGADGASNASHYYENMGIAPAAVYQATPNAGGSVARFFLAGYGFNFISDDDVDGVPDYVTHLHKTLSWFENEIDDPVGIDPVAFENALGSVYPNPFNPTTTIPYAIAERSHVSLKIYDVAGQRVRTLVDEVQAPRPEGFTVTWDGRDESGREAASGVYFCRLTSAGQAQTKKLVLVR